VRQIDDPAVAEVAARMEEFKSNWEPDGLDWPADVYPQTVPAFTAKVATGVLGQALVGSNLLHTVLDEEARRLREEFNTELEVLAVASHGRRGEDKMLLSFKPMSLEEIEARWAGEAIPLDLGEFARHIRDTREAGGEHRLILDLTGSLEEKVGEPGMWDRLADLYEEWVSSRINIVTAEDADPAVALYVLGGVMIELEHYEEMEDLWDEEEAALGPATEAFQEGRLEGELHAWMRARGEVTTTWEERAQEHVALLGVNPARVPPPPLSPVQSGHVSSIPPY